VKLNKIAEDLHADGVLIVNPYYNKGTQSSLVDHYKYISERTQLPIILYNVPSRTAMNMQPETILKIHSACHNVVAVKEASGDISQIANLIAMKPEELGVLSGNDDQTLPIMALGGVGVISVFSNPFPLQMVEITNAMLSGNLTKARELNIKYLKMMNLLFVETSPMPVKFACSYLGLCKNTLRLPLKPITENSTILIKKEIEKIK
jgi:4-hydroxy-tetrahydrodipicolinate synthase